MEQFIVSARKYRPTNFESLIGQNNIAKTLKNSIMRNQLAHAYLFCGPRGVGKTSAARIFAKTINCSNLSDKMEPCGKCESCLSFAEGRSFSIHELDAASNNSVEDIRSLTDQVRIPPQIGKYSVYIIDEVHMLSQSAFNAFLKTLEEPPAHAIFILATTEKHKILPTILSRCQTYDFNRISVEDIVLNLKDIAQKESVTISDDALHIIAQKADGAMRDALTLFDQMVAFCGKEISYEQVIKNLNVLDYDYYFKLTDDFLSGDYAAAMILFDEILSKGFNALHFISGLSRHFRDLIVCKNGASLTLLELAPTVAQKYRTISEKCSLDFLYSALEKCTSCEASYKQSGNQRLLIEFTLLSLSRLMGTGLFAVQQVSVAQGVASQKASAPQGVASQNASAPPQVVVSEKALAPQGVASQNATAPQIAIVPSAMPQNSTADQVQPQQAQQPVQPQPVQPQPVQPQPVQPQPVASTEKVVSPADSDAAKAKTLAPAPKSRSIKSILSEVNSQQTKVEQEVEQVEVFPFIEDNIAIVWKKMAEAENALPRLASAINQIAPKVDFDTKQFLFIVNNQAQKDWIIRTCQHRLEQFLRKSFADDAIQLVVDITPDDGSHEGKKIYMSSNKAEFLRETSPDFKDLQNDMGLKLS